MEPRREQALVGLFVLVAAALLIVTVFALSGAFGRAGKTFRATFDFAGGLEPGAEVRFIGGPKVGRVESLQISPRAPGHLEITFSVRPDTPVKTDSTVKIMSLSPLGENHLEVSGGTPQAALAQNNAQLPSTPYVDFNAITAQLNAIGPRAQTLLDTLNQRATELQITIARVNDLLNEQNRTNLTASLSSARGILEENRPKLKASMTHIETASAKLAPLLDDFKKTVKEANDAITQMDAMIGEDRPDLRAAIADLRRTLANTTSLTGQLDRTLQVNAENIDELLENFRHTAENLKEFTEMIKTRPSTLIRSSGPPDRKPGGSRKP